MKKFEIVEDFIQEKDGEIDCDVTVDISKFRVIAFYGALTTNVQEALVAIRGTKLFLQDMGVEGFEVYATYYTRRTLLGFLKYERASESEKDTIREEFSNAVGPLFDELLWPLIQKNGQRIASKEVEDNFKKIVFRGHCMGSLMITNLGNMLCKRMAELGFSEQEIKDLTFNIRAIFSSSIVLTHEIDDNFDIY